jgi:hypothetical protein
LAVATDTLWVPFGTKQPRPTAPDGRPAQVVDVTLRLRFDPLSTVVATISRETLDSRARARVLLNSAHTLVIMMPQVWPELNSRNQLAGNRRLSVTSTT